MKIEFRMEASKTYEFLRFPTIVYREHNMDDENKKRFITKKELEVLDSIAERLDPYKNIIDRYYRYEFLEGFDIARLLTFGDRLINEPSIDDYFESLKDLKEDEIESNMINIFAENMGVEISREELSNTTSVLHFIEGLKIDDVSKWNLLKALKDSKNVIEDYSEFMLDIKPIFLDYYNYEEDVILTGERLEERLKKGGKEEIRTLTNDIMSETVLDNLDEINIIVTGLYPGSAEIFISESYPYIAWGLNLERAFNLLKEREKDRLARRIDVFKSLGDETRYKLLIELVNGEKNNKEIAEELDVSGATISYHVNRFLTMKILQINDEVDGGRYSLNKELLLDSIEAFKNDLNL